MPPEEIFDVLPPLAEALVPEGVERATLLEHVHLGAEVNDRADAADPLVEHYVKFGGSEGRSDLVLHHLHAHTVARNFGALLDRFDTAEFPTNGAVAPEGMAAGGAFEVA